MELAALWLSGSALLLSLVPRIMPTIQWVANCETCLRIRQAISTMLG